MTRLSKTLFVAAALLAAPVSSAFAQEQPADAEPPAGGEGGEGGEGAGGGEGGAAPEASPPPDGGMAPATTGGSFLVAKGKIRITGQTLGIGLFPDNAGKPLSLAPAVYYGVSDKLNVGITHDGGTTWLTPRPSVGFSTIDVLGIPVPVPAGRGICVSGEEGLCPKVYNNIGFDGLFSLKEDAKFAVAAHGGLDINSFDAFTLAVRLGALGRYMATDKISIVFDPRIQLGITERDSGNKEAIDIPVWGWFQAMDKLAVYLNTGIAGPLDGFGDAFTVPVGFGANYVATEKVTVGADFSFLNLAGSDGDADAKMVGLRAIIDI